VIIAFPTQRIGEFHPVGGPLPTPPPFKAAVTWYRWYCTDCRVESKPANAWSDPVSALDRGEYHEQVAQCQRVGQLELFAVGGAR
jgi:hypothetical protein